eukprot:4077336-Prymnesium_polylepis.3
MDKCAVRSARVGSCAPRCALLQAGYAGPEPLCEIVVDPAGRGCRVQLEYSEARGFLLAPCRAATHPTATPHTPPPPRRRCRMPLQPGWSHLLVVICAPNERRLLDRMLVMMPFTQMNSDFEIWCAFTGSASCFSCSTGLHGTWA